MRRPLTAVSLVMAPLLQAVSTFFWRDGRYGTVTSTLVGLALVFWIVGQLGLFELLRPAMPRWAAVGTVMAAYGCVGGVAFSVQGVFEEALALSGEESLRLLNEHPLAANLLWWLPGPLFPLTLLALGATLARTRIVPLAAGVLVCCGAAAFPLSRITREPLLAHLADALLLAAFGYVAWLLARQAARPGPTAAPR